MQITALFVRYGYVANGSTSRNLRLPLVANRRRWQMKKKSLLMNLTCTILFVTCLQISAAASSQEITISAKNVSLEQVFDEITRQSGYQFFFNQKLLKKANKVSLQLSKATLKQALELCFKGQPFDYAIVEGTVVVKKKKDIASIIETLDEEPPVETIRGTIKDEKGNPLGGASVRIKDATKSSLADELGTFSISANRGDRLLITFVGYEPQELVVGAQTDLRVIMKVAENSLPETVVIGYGNKSKALLTGSITSVKSSEISEIPTSNLSNVLAGRLSGVLVSQSTGTPGVAAGVRVRSVSSWNTSSPLFVIDGVVRNADAFNMLDPNEVESVTVLKDGASVAIYGSRAANGVILVTTKRGIASAKPQIQYSGTFSVDRPTKVPEVMGIYETGIMSNTVFTPAQPWGYFSPEDLSHAQTVNGGFGYDWYDAAYQTPYTNRHALSISGGSEKVQYYLGGSYFDESGYLPNVKFNKYNLRGKVTAKLNDNLTVNVNLATEYGSRRRFNFTYDYGSTDLNNLWGKLLYQNPLTPHEIDGNPVNPGWLGSPIEMMKSGGYWNNSTQRIDALLSVDYKIPGVPGLVASLAFSKNNSYQYTKSYAKRQLLYNYKTTGPTGKIYTDTILGTTWSGDPGNEYLSNDWGRENPYQLNGQLSYKKQIGQHHVDAVLVYEQYESFNSYFNGARNNFPVINTDQFFATSSNNADWGVGGSETQDARVSYVGRLNYDFNNRYILSLSLRRDGSVKFAPDQRWGWFPAASAGWRLSEENFFKSSAISNIVKELKLRGSYGLVGNDAIGGWAWQERYNASGGFYFGNGYQQGIAYSGAPALNLSWEKTRSYNFGIDANLFRNFSLSADYWFRNTFDILGNRELAAPSTAGTGLPAENYGKVNSSGLDLELAYNSTSSSAFEYYIKANFAYATNKVVLKDVAQNTQDVDDPNGKPVSYMTGFIATDIIRTKADLDALPAGYTIMGYTPYLGVLNYQDIGGPAGIPDGKIDNYDRAVISRYTYESAPYTFGATVGAKWKGISLDVFFQGSAGFKKMYTDGYNRNSLNGGNRSWTIWRDYWTPDNVDAKMPKPADWDASPDRSGSTFWTSDGSFVRLKYVNLAYNIPSKWAQRAGLSNARVFVSATNLLTFSKFNWYDPEIGNAMSYPNVKTLTVGLTLNL